MKLTVPTLPYETVMRGVTSTSTIAIVSDRMPTSDVAPSIPGTKVIAIIGAGFSGLMTLANLLRLNNGLLGPTRFVLIDRKPISDGGVAFRTDNLQHLLNVRASSMSAWPDRPEDFLTFAQRYDPHVTPLHFLPRRIYRSYLHTTLSELMKAAGSRVSTFQIQDEVIGLSPSASSGWRIETALGRAICADLVVLAVGSPPPADPLADRWIGPHSRFIRDPWETPVSTHIRPDDKVLILGTGLTAIDVILDLNHPGRIAPILAISRHGLVPRCHLAQSAPPVDLSFLVEQWADDPDGVTARQMLASVRQHVEATQKAGIPWQPVIDALRPHTQRLWSLLPVSERARFLRHARPFWEVHRHRMPPPVADAISEFQTDKRVQFMAGSVNAVNGSPDGAEVIYTPRGDSCKESLQVSWIVNCSGPSRSCLNLSNTFLEPLLDAGILCADEFRLGLITDDCCRALAPTGRAHPNLLVAGALRKATLWESTAVPELRAQARAVADTALAFLLQA